MAATRVLLLSGGEVHDYKGCGRVLARIFEEDRRFELTYVENDLGCLEDGTLAGTDVLVLYWTLGELTGAQRGGLLDWLARGKGFVGVHCAADSFKTCPEYRAMIGGWFLKHPRFRPYQVSVADPSHPITRDMDEFMVEDEMYVTDYDPRVQALASSLWRGGTVPVAWTKDWGAGRVFYLALGHNPEACSAQVFSTLLTRGALWAAEPPAGE